MNLGLHPRLKARPSFLDLIRNQQIDTLSVAPIEHLDHEQLPQLPLSPLPAKAIPVEAAEKHQNEEDCKMAPQRDADGEEQYGLCLLR
jgi:hypothetical protein